MVWVDARINSIKRNPHEYGCSCQYYVNLYVNQGSFDTEIRTLGKKVREVGLNKISILQKLERNPCEVQPHRWDSSEDCYSVPQTKLLLGKFLSDLTWLTLISVVRNVSLCARSLDSKIVYQIFESDAASSSVNSESPINVVNFKVEDEATIPVVAEVDISTTRTVEQLAHDSSEDEVTPSYTNVRRSKRRNVKPERYSGCDDAPVLNVGFVRTRPYKIRRLVDEESVPSVVRSGVQETRAKKRVGSVDKVNHGKEIIHYRRRKRTTKEVISGTIPFGNPVAVVHPSPFENVARNNAHEGAGDISSQYSHFNDVNKSNFEPHKRPAMSGNVEKVADFLSRSRSKLPRKNSFGLDDMDLEPRMEGLNCRKTQREKKYGSTSSRNRNLDAEQARGGRSSNSIAYQAVIDSYLKNRNTMPTEEELSIKDQWKKATNLEKKNEMETSQNEEEELPEIDMLWREMDEALASCHLLEETEDSNVAVFAETREKPSIVCPHDYREDEEIGIYCNICGHVKIQIKHMTPPFLEHYYVRYQEEEQCSREESGPKVDEDDDFHLFSSQAACDEHKSDENENVWSLIPELRQRMHIHQKKAFEFLWQNIAGSTKPALMESESKRRGGCVISHSPGAGKTFLVIAFLVSYLKLFPKNRPLVLAPKTTLYTWYKEFIKWDISIPVYLIHARKSQREFEQTAVAIPGVPKPNDDVKHVLDCLEKIKRWQEEPSVLVMGYSSFLSLTREDSKYPHRRYITKVLKESTGILIMDEGHNPRSTRSRLRKALMKVNTELRILLSGTLFQNNFCEYFNTLCLARPKFVNEVLTKLDPKYTRKGKAAVKARHLLEVRARKFFLHDIAKKIDSNGDERMQGLNTLKNMTSGFIDVYDNGNSDTLSGLQIYTLLMNPTNEQGKILKTLHKKMHKYRGYPIEIELLITLGSIHPWLVKTSTCAEKFFTEEQLKDLETNKFNLKIGCKVRFVLSLVYRVVKKEKVLIFCHNIAPVKLLIELFENCFHWKKDQEILVLNGEQEVFERGKVIDKFEEAGGVSKVLIASITACSEGISLTAASRVIMLDSEWNPSKTKQAIARAFRPGQQKMVYVYQLMTKGSMEEDKYRRTTWKEWVSSMIFSEDFVEDPSQWQAEKIEDDILREMIEEDKSKLFHMIMKNEKASTN
ncbi:hypothetical protein RIF29_08776 [Crotalaria pallida]|uniref:Uncharacterized protein n=1 Tax=Crotalaria pallida TaxID=3830 RepID=A0AAN9FR79_CROPI